MGPTALPAAQGHPRGSLAKTFTPTLRREEQSNPEHGHSTRRWAPCCCGEGKGVGALQPRRQNHLQHTDFPWASPGGRYKHDCTQHGINATNFLAVLMRIPPSARGTFTQLFQDSFSQYGHNLFPKSSGGLSEMEGETGCLGSASEQSEKAPMGGKSLVICDRR